MFDESLELDRPKDEVSAEDKAYYQQRAEAEIELAQAAEHERAVRSHYLLAGYYLDLVHHDHVIDEG